MVPKRTERAYDRFLDGEDSGTFRELEIVNIEHSGRVLTGFKHMAIAFDPYYAEWGPVGFTGWLGVSSQADRMVSGIVNRLDDNIQASPSMSHLWDKPSHEALEGMVETGVDYQAYHNRFQERH